jgi:hypothetical protein
MVLERGPRRDAAFRSAVAAIALVGATIAAGRRIGIYRLVPVVDHPHAA